MPVDVLVGLLNFIDLFLLDLLNSDGFVVVVVAAALFSCSHFDAKHTSQMIKLKIFQISLEFRTW